MMAHKIDEIEIDLTKIDLFGWQKQYCPLTVRVMREAIKINQTLPAVDVVPKGDGFELCHNLIYLEDGSNRGGHHRAVAYYSLKGLAKLHCDVFKEHKGGDPNKEFYHISMLTPRDIPLWSRLDDALEHLPENSRGDVVREFCNSWGFDLGDFVR